MDFKRLTKVMTLTSQHRSRIARAGLFLIAMGSPLLAQTSPWESAVQSLQTSFTGPIAKGLALVAIVVGGLMFAFGEGGSKKMLSGIIFGLGMALGAVNFVSWLFPSS